MRYDLYSDYAEVVTQIDVMRKAVIHYERQSYDLIDYEFIKDAEDYLKLYFVKP